MTKRNKIIYWVSTLWLASGMLATGTLQLFKAKAEGALAPPGVYGITHLGYPIYLLTILGVWKILGVVAVLIPKFPLLKEWAYAGFFFVMTAAFSHIAVGDPMKERNSWNCAIGAGIRSAKPSDGHTGALTWDSVIMRPLAAGRKETRQCKEPHSPKALAAAGNGIRP